MLGAPVKGTTILFGDNKSMITNVSFPHSTLKKRNQANNYHHAREAVTTGITSFIHCDTKYNLADMGTKALPGPTHQFLLQNQHFPPVSTAGECQTDMNRSVKSEGKAKLTLSMMSQLETEVACAFVNKGFQMSLMKSCQNMPKQ